MTNFHIGQLPVPPLSLGTMNFGTTVGPEASRQCLDTAFELGARFWDTANNYAFWNDGGVGDESEETLGQWFADRGPRARDQVVLATKVGARPRRPGAGLEDVLGLSASAVREQLDGSLRRLQTDHVDVLYAHVDDRAVPFEETLGVLHDLVAAGLVQEVAASNLTADRLREAVAVGQRTGAGYQALQQRFGYLVSRPGADLGPHVMLDDVVSGTCTDAGLTRLGYSPLLAGAYLRPERMPAGYDGSGAALDALRQVSQAAGIDAGQTVLAWMVGRPDAVVPVVGVSRPKQVTSAWGAVGTQLPADAVQLLDQARLADVPAAAGECHA